LTKRFFAFIGGNHIPEIPGRRIATARHLVREVDSSFRFRRVCASERPWRSRLQILCRASRAVIDPLRRPTAAAPVVSRRCRPQCAVRGWAANRRAETGPAAETPESMARSLPFVGHNAWTAHMTFSRRPVMSSASSSGLSLNTTPPSMVHDPNMPASFPTVCLNHGACALQRLENRCAQNCSRRYVAVEVSMCSDGEPRNSLRGPGTMRVDDQCAHRRWCRCRRARGRAHRGEDLEPRPLFAVYHSVTFAYRFPSSSSRTRRVGECRTSSSDRVRARGNDDGRRATWTRCRRL